MIKAEFKSYGSYTTDSVSQWDLNQKLTISGLDIDVAPVLAFSCFGMYESIIVQSKLSDGVITCDVPNAILQFGKNLNVDLCSETGGQYKAFEKMIIPVNRRKKPSDYLFTDNVPLSTAESIKADLEKEINSNKTYTDKVKAELKNDNKTLNRRIDTILTGTVNTTKLVTVHSATIKNNSASDLTFKISSKDNETLKSIKDKSPTVIDTNVIARALDGVAINGASIPSSYNVESTNDEYVITVYSGSSSVVGQYVFMAVATIAYKDTATDISSAELKDIRTGANGTTYPTAGDAVRGQISDLKKELDDSNLDENVSQIQKNMTDISQLKSDTSRIKKNLRTTYVDMNLFALGTINKDTGEEESSNKILRSIIDVNATEDITIKLPKGYQWNVAYWLAGKYRSDLWNENSWYQNLTIEKTTANYKYRILIRRSDGADITLSELIGVAETNREDLQSFDKIDDLKKKLNEVDKKVDNLSIETDTTLTKTGKAADSAVVGQQIDELKESLGNVNEEISGLKGVGSGLTTEQKRYIVALFKSAVYSENMSDMVTALENSFNTIPATGIKLSPTTIKFSGIGDTQKITATLTPDTATSSILWESDNTDVVTVKDGVATAVSDGIATITATSGSATAKCSVNVNTKELYSVSNKVCNADFYEATGLKLGSDSANGYAKSWTLLANFSTTAGAIVYGLNTSAKGCDFGTNGANNAQLMWCSNTCTATRSANNNWCYALTHEANSNTITIYEYINDEFKKTVGVVAYMLPNASTYAGEICVGGKTSAAYVGTIYDLSIVMRKLTDDEILQFLKSGVY